MPLRLTTRRVAFVAVALLVAAGATAWAIWPLPFKEQFRRSKPELDAFALRVSQNGPALLSSPPNRIGYFKVIKCEPLPAGFVFQSDYGNPFDWCGLAYSTTPLAEFEYDANGKVKQVFKPIRTNWYEVFRP